MSNALDAQSVSNGKSRQTTQVGIASLVFLVVLYCGGFITYALIVPKVSGGTSSDAANFGDMFGAFNAFFSGLAFVGVVYAVLLQAKQVRMQSEELRLQREELAQTRKELARSATAQEKAEEALTAQLRATAISARLSALNLLINEEIEHLAKFHEDILGDSHPRALTVGQINAYIRECEKKKAEGTEGSRDPCFHRNMIALREYKMDLEALYSEIKQLSA